MNDRKFQPVSPNFDFAKSDLAILEFWQKNQIFEKSEVRNLSLGKAKYFVFYDGPPGTNGPPHIGHIMQSALKDVWPRFKTMQGYTVLRKAGWDTHGLPVELASEKELGLSGKVDIERYGIAKFVEYCRDTVLRCRNDWIQTITRLGRFVDFKNDYLTMSNDFIQSDWWVMKQAFKKNLVYKDYKIVPYCARCGTGLSSHEVAQGYEDITDLTITAKFQLIGDENTFVLAWTTTPWTLLGNIALILNAEIEYSKIEVQTNGKIEYIILATEAIERNRKGLGEDFRVVSTFSGSELVGRGYLPLWDFTRTKGEGKIHEIVSDGYVTTEDGTGVVHAALYGEDDFRLIKKFGFVQNQHVGPDGHFNSDCGPYSGRYFREDGLDVEIVKDLAARGLLFDKYRYEHSYPHCWRCKTALMYFAKSSWFIRTTAIKDLMIAENKKINWQPPHIRDGRFGNWLENNVDWAVSRDRYWGSPMPIWSSQKDPTRRICVESVAELVALGAYFESSGKPIPQEIDLHLPLIDDVVIKKGDELYRREAGVLDCWYNAGSMPWGQFGYPAKPGSQELFADQFPSDFICEAIDQTRGWFYTLLAVSCLASGQSSFKNVICTDHVLDAKGKKMSKSVGNVVAPLPLLEKFGADAVRWTFYQTNPWQPIRYSEELLKEVLRSVLIPIWNCYSFLVTYAELDAWTPTKTAGQSTIELDAWILSSLKSTIRLVTESLERYDIATASGAIAEFVEGLSNWYIRRSRRRFWKSEDDSDKLSAYATLYEVLVTLAKLSAPMCPFISELIYRNLVRSFEDDAPESVHLCDWPDSNKYIARKDLEAEIAVIQEAASLARALRTEHGLKVRQPLSKLMVTPATGVSAAALERHLESLRDEVNVKQILIVTDSADYVTFTIKPNWKTLGPRFGSQMNDLNKVVQTFGSKEIALISQGKDVPVTLAGQEHLLTKDELILSHQAKPGMVAQSGRRVTVALDTALTQELIVEGDARELLSVIQRQRKNLSFEINDQIEVVIYGPSKIEAAVTAHKDYIARECLAKSFAFGGLSANDTNSAQPFDINGHEVKIVLRKV